MSELQIGSRVLSKSSKVNQFVRKVISCHGQGHKKRYHVEWESGNGSGDYPKNSVVALPTSYASQPEEYQKTIRRTKKRT
eukprot:scaffold1171_cov132-Ochromonas_danica.AAC.2